MGLANDFYDRAQQDFDRAQRDWETEPDYEDFDDPREVCGVLGQLADLYGRMSRAKYDTEYAVPPESAARIAQALDSAEMIIRRHMCAIPEVLRAKWIYYRDELGTADIRFAECSNCKEVSSPVYRYCPHCGAYMSNRR